MSVCQNNVVFRLYCCINFSHLTVCMFITIGCLSYIFPTRSLTHGILQLDAGRKFFCMVGNSVNQKTAITVTKNETFPCRILAVSSESRRFVARLCGTLLAEAQSVGWRHSGPHCANHTEGRQCLQRAQPWWPMGQQHSLPILRCPRRPAVRRLPDPLPLFACHRSTVLLQHESVRRSARVLSGPADGGEINSYWGKHKIKNRLLNMQPQAVSWLACPV